MRNFNTEFPDRKAVLVPDNREYEFLKHFEGCETKIRFLNTYKDCAETNSLIQLTVNFNVNIIIT